MYVMPPPTTTTPAKKPDVQVVLHYKMIEKRVIVKLGEFIASSQVRFNLV
jgi:hypothetical protein